MQESSGLKPDWLDKMSLFSIKTWNILTNRQQRHWQVIFVFPFLGKGTMLLSFLFRRKNVSSNASIENHLKSLEGPHTFYRRQRIISQIFKMRRELAVNCYLLKNCVVKWELTNSAFSVKSVTNLFSWNKSGIRGICFVI